MGNELPEGWIETTLEEILPIRYGKGLVEAIRDENGHFPVYGSSGVVGFHNAALTSKATLISGRKGSVGSVYYSPNPCWPIDTTYFVEENDDLDLKFFLYLLASLHLNQLDKSTAIPGLSRDDYNATKIKLAPLPEQHRIVAAIEQQFSRLDAAVTSLQHARAKLKRQRAAILKAAVEGKLTADWRAQHPASETAEQLLQRILHERRAKWEAEQLAKMQAKGVTPKDNKWKDAYKEPEPPVTTELPGLPEGWCWVSVEQASYFVRYGTSAKTSEDDTGIAVLRMGNIQDGDLEITNLKYLPADHPEFPGLLLEDGDLLFNRTNSPELVGKSAVYHGNPSICSYASYLIAVRPLTGCLSDYLCYFLNSSAGRAWVKSVVTQQVGQANVNGSKLQALAFPLPPLSEQQQIVSEVEARLSIIAQTELEVEANLKRAERLRQTILAQAFAGRLVPQDPRDEPASVLLERIRQQREQRDAMQGMHKKGKAGNGRAATAFKVPGEPVKMDVEGMEQVELWESVGG